MCDGTNLVSRVNSEFKFLRSAPHGCPRVPISREPPLLVHAFPTRQAVVTTPTLAVSSDHCSW